MMKGVTSLGLGTIGLLFVAAPLMGACEASEDDDDGGGCGLVAGDLVITEIMANPDGADDGLEWWEIHNPGSEPVALKGLLLQKTKADGTGRKLWPVQAEGEIEPGGYFVVGDVPDDSKPDHVDYGYDNGLTALPNSEGYLAVMCGSTVLDEVTYGDAPDGASLALDAASTDASSNDKMENWCASTQPNGDFKGTPGAANSSCGGHNGPTTCLDGEESRDAVTPEEGDIVISELHANPSAVGDSEGEYLELYVANTVDLNGVGFSRDPADEEPEFVIGDTECVRVEGGTYFVLAASETANGGVSPDYLLDMTLGNSAGTIIVSLGSTVLDQIEHGSASDGESYSLDPRHLDPSENDDEGFWCESTSAYGDGDLGTPGAENDQCEIAGPAGQCDDDGTMRDTVTPAAGDLVITELMQNPAGVADSEGEWFEICATRDVDLNGLEIGKEGEVAHTVSSSSCLSVSSGDCFVIATAEGGEAGADNGFVPADYVWSSLSLTNGSSNLFIGYDGTELDAVSWSGSEAGVSWSYYEQTLSTEGNDDADNWCEGATAWSTDSADLGTPGEPNPACGGEHPLGDTCLDGSTAREIVAPSAGEVIITEIMANPESTGTDETEEWIELYVTGDFDLNALQLGETADSVQQPTHPTDAGNCMPVTSGSYVIIARSASATTVTPDAVWSQMVLANGSDDVWVGVDGTELDSYTWSSDAGDGDTICRMSTSGSDWGEGADGGTPGSENTSCTQ